MIFFTTRTILDNEQWRIMVTNKLRINTKRTRNSGKSSSSKQNKKIQRSQLGNQETSNIIIDKPYMIMGPKRHSATS